MAVLAAGLAGCPTPAEKSAEMTMVLQGGLAEDIKAGGGELPRETITAVYVVVDEVTLQQTDGSSVTIFKGPFEVDILSLQGIGTVMAAVDIPVGSYTGGVMTLSGAEAELSGEPGVRVPLALPNGGQYAFEDAFTVAADSTGVLPPSTILAISGTPPSAGGMRLSSTRVLGASTNSTSAPASR